MIVFRRKKRFLPISRIVTGFLKAIVSGGIFVCLNACVGQYYGLTEAEWQLLNSEQKEKAKADYQALVAQKNKYIHENKIETATTELINRGVEKNREADN